MQEQDDSDKWKIVHRLFGYILLQNLFKLHIAYTALFPQNISNEHIVGLSNAIA